MITAMMEVICWEEKQVVDHRLAADALHMTEVEEILQMVEVDH